jgi:hypothetical protein
MSPDNKCNRSRCVYQTPIFGRYYHRAHNHKMPSTRMPAAPPLLWLSLSLSLLGAGYPSFSKYERFITHSPWVDDGTYDKCR